MIDRIVQHRSGIGMTFSVNDFDCEHCWHSHDNTIGKTFYLPKSEYIEVPPPKTEEWIDVTEACTFEDGKWLMHRFDGGSTQVDMYFSGGYRLTKVPVRIVEAHTLRMSVIKHAFVVERLKKK